MGRSYMGGRWHCCSQKLMLDKDSTMVRRHLISCSLIWFCYIPLYLYQCPYPSHSRVSLKKMTSLCRTWAVGRFTCFVTIIPNIMPWSKVLGVLYTLFYISINGGSPVKTKCVFYVIFKCGRYPKLLIGNNEIVIYRKANECKIRFRGLSPSFFNLSINEIHTDFQAKQSLRLLFLGFTNVISERIWNGFLIL